MGFKVIENSDITKIEADVIINSVGVDTTNYGGICGSIVKACESKELESIIKRVKDVYTVGDFFITEGYALKDHIGHIFHLILPHANNDENYSQYKECIRIMLNECKYRKWKRIGIPSIGTGANKYDKKIAKQIINDMCSAYADIYKDMDITLVLAPEKISRENQERLNNINYSNQEYHSSETLKKFEKGSKKFEDTMKLVSGKQGYTKVYFEYDKYVNGSDGKDIIIKNCKTIGEYVDGYIEAKCKKEKKNNLDEKYFNRRINLYFSYGKKGKDDYIHAGSDAYGSIKYNYTAEKKQFYKLMFALKMTDTEANYFLQEFGYCFAKSGINPIDDKVKELLNNRWYGQVEVDNKFKEVNLPSIFKK